MFPLTESNMEKHVDERRMRYHYTPEEVMSSYISPYLKCKFTLDSFQVINFPCSVPLLESVHWKSLPSLKKSSEYLNPS